MKFKLLTLCTLLCILFVLTACEFTNRLEQLDAAEHTLEAELKTAIKEEIVLAMTEFTSATEQVSLMVPTDWVTTEDAAGDSLLMANSEVALAHFKANQIEPGDVVLKIGFLPAQFFDAFEVPMGTSQSLLESFMPALRIAGDNAASTAVSDIKVVSLADQREAALVTVTDNQREGAFIISEAAEGVTAVISVVAYPGEFETVSDISLAIAATVEFNSTSEALWQAMLAAE